MNFIHCIVVIKIPDTDEFFYHFVLILFLQFFGFVAMCAYAYDAFLKYQMYNMVVTNVVTRTTTVTVA